MTDDHVTTAVAVLELARTATADDVTAITMIESPAQLETKLAELQQAPLAFLAQLDDDLRIRFVNHARERFLRRSA